MKKNLFLLIIPGVLFSSNVFSQNIIPVAAGTDGISVAYAAAVSGDIIELTSDGGLYIETAMLIVTGKDITIRAASGLVNKPVWACIAVSAYGGLMQISAGITVNGIIMDGTASTPATVNGIITEGASGLYDIKISNSTFRNFNVALYGSSGAQVDSVIIDNCLLENFTDNAIIFYGNPTAPGSFKYLSVTNSTFRNPVYRSFSCIYTIASDALYSPNPGFTPDPRVEINHVTIYNFRRLYCKEHTNVRIKNSIFMIPVVTSSTGFILYGDQTNISNCIYFNVSNSLPAEVIQSNLINANPLFKDAASGDFTLTASSPAYNAGDDGKTIGDPRWWPEESTGYIYLAAGENVISQALALALDSQTFVLTTDGGIYNETAKLVIDKKITIKAADGLLHKPVLTSGSTSAMIEISADFLLKGVILNGALGAALTPIGITNKPGTSGYDLAVLETDFLNFSNAGGTSGFGIFGVPSSVMDSVFIQDCYFKHILDMGISFNDPLTATGSVNHFMVDNCTFWDMNSEAIYVDGSDTNVATKDPQFKVNKVTLYDCGSYCIIAHYIDSAVISNSIVVLPVLNTAYAPTKVYGIHSKVENFLYFNTRDIDMGSGVTDFQFINVVVQEDPMFTDAGNGVFSYPVNSPAVIVGNGGVKICIGDDRWWPTIITGIEDNNILKGLSNGYELNQNYPNPFNSATKISYKVPVSGKVVLKVYNAVGGEIMMLVNEKKMAGSYDVSFDASSLANGTYYYRLKAGSFDNTKKMILLK